MKKCFKCKKTKPLEDFHKHPKMADGHLNKCKECSKSDIKSNRKKNVDYYREYDRARGNRQEKGYLKEYRSINCNKYLAHTAVNNAIRDGLLVKQACEECGKTETVHAHHDDYSKPLEVRWLCAAHHRQWHILNGEALNG